LSTPGNIVTGRVEPTLEMVRGYFRDQARDQQGLPEFRNPHLESPVSAKVKASAISSAVLIPVVVEDNQLSNVVVTRRHENIRFGGHICFPGGRTDADESAIATALRESEEEIGLNRDDVEVLGCLGNYFTQAGYKITPVVGLIQNSANFNANADEVSEIHQISFTDMLDSSRYALTRYSEARGHYSFSQGQLRIAGPTVSVMIGFFETLLAYRNNEAGDNGLAH